MKHLPNLFSLARLALAPYLFVLLWQREYRAALVVILIAGISDGIDGWLARKLNAYSRFGAILDPIADKVMLSGAFLTLALDGAIEKWLAWIVLGRDAGILLFAAGAFLFSKAKRDFPPSFLGKASTVAQIAFVVAVVGHFAGYLPVWLVDLGKWIVAGFALWSGLDYLRRAGRNDVARTALPSAERK